MTELSERDWELFVTAVENPKEPSERMRKIAARYMRAFGLSSTGAKMINELRFVIRDGQRILQMAVTGDVIDGEWIEWKWVDVPLVTD